MELYALKPYLYWGGVAFFLLCEHYFSYRAPTVPRPGAGLPICLCPS